MKSILVAVCVLFSTVTGLWAQPPTEIQDGTVWIQFDHDKGEIDFLLYTQGSGRDILDQHFVHGLGRLHGLGEADLDEDNTILSDWTVGDGWANFLYTNPLYGSKMLDITWSWLGGVEVVLTFFFDHNDFGRCEGAYWEPGGSNNPHDFGEVFVALESKTRLEYQYLYPGPWSVIYEGPSHGIAMWDEEYNEKFGYRTPCYMYVTVAEGTAAIGPYHSMQLAGTYALYFACKKSADFDTWSDSIPKEYQSCDSLLTAVAENFGDRRNDLLGQNYPNPFNPETLIEYELARPGPVTLVVFDTQGRRVRVLVDDIVSAGRYEAVWDGLDHAGRDVSPGVYFYRIETDHSQTMKKMVLVK